MKEIKTDKARLLIVEVPEGAKRFIAHKITLRYDINGLVRYIPLPSGNWEPLGFTDEITEEQAVEIVQKQGCGYKDYEGNPANAEYLQVLFSFQSLLTANSITERSLVLIEKK